MANALRVIITVVLVVILALFLSHVRPADAAVETTGQIEIYYSPGCVDCVQYMDSTLLPELRARGWGDQISIVDYASPDGRERLAALTQQYNIPYNLIGSLYTILPHGDKTLILDGHIPPALLTEALALYDHGPVLLVSQPEMHGEPHTYQLWAGQGEGQTFDLTLSLNEALPRLADDQTPGLLSPSGAGNVRFLLPTVLATGLLDGINPCAFAVILLLIAFLFTIRQSRGRVYQLGGAYIAVIFAVYLLIGLGLLKAVALSSDTHFMARVGAWLVIVLGFVNLAEYFFPRFPIRLHMPAFAHEQTYSLLKKATLPATLGMGFLVGLCTFPCSGGIYVSIITLLASQATVVWGVLYLILYNLMFILPLVLILVLAGNRVTAKAWAAWERRHTGTIRLWYGAAMLGLGVVLLGWLV